MSYPRSNAPRRVRVSRRWLPALLCPVSALELLKRMGPVFLLHIVRSAGRHVLGDAHDVAPARLGLSSLWCHVQFTSLPILSAPLDARALLSRGTQSWVASPARSWPRTVPTGRAVGSAPSAFCSGGRGAIRNSRAALRTSVTIRPRHAGIVEAGARSSVNRGSAVR